MFVILWQFQVKGGLEKEFEKAYGPEGPWADLFRASPAYRGTRLLRDASLPAICFTLDCWAMQADYDAFRSENAAAYSTIDRQCEVLTESETSIGSFEAYHASHP
jgi:hypothetical protein